MTRQSKPPRLPPAPPAPRWEPSPAFTRALQAGRSNGYPLVAGAMGCELVDGPKGRGRAGGRPLRWKLVCYKDWCGQWTAHVYLDVLIVKGVLSRRVRLDRAKFPLPKPSPSARPLGVVYARYMTMITGADSPAEALDAVVLAAVVAKILVL